MDIMARWTPVRDPLRLHDELSRLFGATGRGEAPAPAWTPAVDISEDAEGSTLRADLPGRAPSDIDRRGENATLTLRGERKLEREERNDYHRIDRRSGSFIRSFTLPPTVDPEKVRAEARDGVLTVFLPRREEAKP